MGKRRQSETAMLERRRRERQPGGGRMIAMRIDVVFGGDDHTILSAGGLWDRRAKAYESEATEGVQILPHAGELPAIEWFMTWIRIHAGRRDNPPPLDEAALQGLDNHEVDPAEVFSALFAGGRRGGKTWTAALLCVIYALAFPGAIVWVVNPSDEKHEECRRYFARLLAPEWIDHHTEADGWWLANGSEIMLKSGYTGADPDAIKEGEAHIIWLNEAQKMKPRVYIVARAAIADRSGLVLCCANPPVEAKDQPWVGDLAADAQANRRMSHYLHFDPRDNPYINRTALLSMRFELDERSYRIEILGEFLPSIDKVAYNWLRTRGGNEQAMPEPDDPVWIDVTEEFCNLVELGDRITNLIGLDFQIHPHLGGPVLRVFAPRSEIPTRDNVVLWGVDEVIVEGDEFEWCAEAHHKRYDPETTQLIGDGTGEYQHTQAPQDRQPAAAPRRQGLLRHAEDGRLLARDPARHVDPSQQPARDRPLSRDDLDDRVLRARPPAVPGPRPLPQDRQGRPRMADGPRQTQPNP
jgi:hypothetical protein